MTDERPQQRADEVTLAVPDLLRFLRRVAPLAVGLALVGGMVAALYTWGFLDPVYRARASLIIRQMRGDQSLATLVLPADGYLQLARSRQVLGELRRTLEAQGVASAEVIVNDGHLEARLIRPERWEPGNVLLLELEATSADPDEAARIANAWAEVLIEVDDRILRVAALEQVEVELGDFYDRILERQVFLQEEVALLRQQMEAIPPLLSLQTRISDRELLSGTAATGAAALTSQQPNPLYNELAAKLTTDEIELTKLEPQRERLGRDLEVVRQEFAMRGITRKSAMGAAYPPPPAAATTGEAGLQGVPSAEQMGLQVKRALSVRGGTRLLEVAVRPTAPRPRHAFFRILAAVLGGAILGFLIAAGREALRPAVPKPATPKPGT